MEQCLDVEDRCISKHHLAIHCVQYADDDDHKVDPMVWARVLSNNAIIFHRKGIDNDKDAGILVNKFYGDFLLSPGDSMQLTSKIQILFTVPERGKPNSSALDASQRAECKIFAPRYRLSQRVLGFGGYAKVYVANDEKTGKQLACKVVKQARPRHHDDNQMRPSKKKSAEIVAREFNVLKKLSHPNIIQLEAVISTPYNVYIFQDLISGGDLMSHVEKTGCLQEPQAAVIIRQLLEAVKYLHAHQIAHRDIKPENILMTSWKEGGRIVLTDFGQSRTIEDLEVVAAKAGAFRMQTMVGTFGYVAPEISRKFITGGRGYSQAVDIWSVGCVTCTILVDDFLFPAERDPSNGLSMEMYDQCMGKIRSGKEWVYIHRRAKDFIKGCLVLDEHDRLTATEALASEWFTHPHYRVEMDAAYERAIADWTPKKYDEDKFNEHIDTTLIVEKAQAVRSQYFETATLGHGSREHTKQLLASPLAPNTSLQRRGESDVQSTFIPDPPPYENDEFGDDSFQHLSPEDCHGLDAVPPKKLRKNIPDSFDFSSFPAPPPLPPRKKLCR